VVHYCVSNITASVPMIASRALSAALLPFLVQIAENSLEEAIQQNPTLAQGVAIYKGYVVKPHLARAVDMPLADLKKKIQELGPEI